MRKERRKRRRRRRWRRKDRGLCRLEEREEVKGERRTSKACQQKWCGRRD